MYTGTKQKQRVDLMKKTVLLLSCLLLSVPLSVFAQGDSTYARTVRPEKAYIVSYFKDLGGIATAPIRWKSRQILTAAGVVGLTALVTTQDLQVHDFFQRNKTTFSSNVSKYGLEPWGSGVYSLPLLGSFYLYGAFAKDNRSREAAMLGVKAFVITGIYAQVFKTLLHRERPYQEDLNAPGGEKISQYDFKGPLGKSGSAYSSMPSGHTTSAFAVATIIASVYKDHKAVPVICYSLAALTGLSRIHDNDHWASDVIMGAAIGYTMAKVIYNSDKWGIHLSPFHSYYGTGVNLGITLK